MDKHAVARVAEEEGDGLVHVGAFGALRVGDEEVELLSGLVKRTGAFAKAEDAFAGRKGEDGVDGAGVVCSALDEAEWWHLDPGGIVVARCVCGSVRGPRCRV